MSAGERLREKILNTFVQIKNEAEKNQICKRKGVGAAVLEIDLDTGIISTYTAINGPSGSANICQNIVGACGCAHAEPRVIMKYLKDASNLYAGKAKRILLSTYSACVNCANIIVDSGIIDAVAYEIHAKYWDTPPRNASEIIESTLPHWTKDMIKQNGYAILENWLNN